MIPYPMTSFSLNLKHQVLVLHLKLVKNDIHFQKQDKIAGYFSRWVEILLEIPHKSILAPILINTFINNKILFIDKSNRCNFADNNTLYTLGKNELDQKRNL